MKKTTKKIRVVKNIVKLGDIAQIYSGGTPSRTKPEYWCGTIPWVKTAQIQNCIVTMDDIEEFITEEGLNNSSAKMVPKGTILMAMYGQGKTRGQVAKLELDATINQACAAIELNDQSDTDFIYQQLLYHYKTIRSLSNSGSQENLSAGLIKKIDIYLPPLTEQKTIADILSIWDEAIKKAEQLIKVKEMRFKWLLNELIVKPDKREGWKKVKLGEVGEIIKGQQLNVAHMKATGRYYALNGGIEPSGRTDDWNTEANTITISEGGNSCGFVNFNLERFWSGGHCYSILNLKKTVVSEYLFFFLKLFEPRLMKLRVGSGLPNIQKKDLIKFCVSFPSVKEQKVICETLNAAKQEIYFTKQLTKQYKMQKQSLMQKLLTGEWRVKV